MPPGQHRNTSYDYSNRQTKAVLDGYADCEGMWVKDLLLSHEASEGVEDSENWKPNLMVDLWEVLWAIG
jgi:hypothetical protein